MLIDRDSLVHHLQSREREVYERRADGMCAVIQRNHVKKVFEIEFVAQNMRVATEFAPDMETARSAAINGLTPNVFELSDTPKGRKPGAQRAVFARTRR